MISLDNAVVYDVESFPNCWTLTAAPLHSDEQWTWEISQYRDDRVQLIQWFNWLNTNQIPMIGFFSENYDYPMVHFIFTNPQCTVEQIYQKNQAIVNSGNDRFGHIIWPRDRFAPQIDLAKVHHFDNRAKSTSLKALQVNMRSSTVMESPIPFGVPVSAPGVDEHVIPYNKHDVKETKRFAHISMTALKFRLGLVEQFGVDCLSWNDTKIGEKMLEQRLGEQVCYDWSSGRKQKRQTVRDRIALNDIIFPYIQFYNPEFQRVLEYMRAQVLTPDDIEDPDASIKTKGVFTGLNANVGGIAFYFGTGGVHASVESQRFEATEEWLIRDIDVEGLYPNVAIVNKLAPEHLGEAFVVEYAKIPIERKLHAKGTVENGSFKLAANGAYGKSNSKYSFLFDPRFTMQITINGQLMLCMLAEWLLTVPTIKLIQCNTDGITYMIHRDHLAAAKAIEARWQEYTALKLEEVAYSHMWIRDVNNYVARSTDGKLKLKGAYWYPDPLDYENSISTTSPPAWHKDFNPVIVPRAAVAAMVHGVPPETFMALHTDPFDFMLRAKVDRASMLLLGDREMQRTMRYYVAKQGAPLIKVSPPPAGAVVGQWKRRNGVTQAEYQRVMQANGGQWDETVCTSNRSKYEDRRISFQAGWNVAECNNADAFRFDNLNYEFYLAEAKKLIIA